MNEPVADIARSVLDGHIVLSRRLLVEGQLPPVDVLESISRVMPEVVSDEHLACAQWGAQIMATYREAEDLINIGAYQVGNNPRIDQAIRYIEHMRAFLRQGHVRAVQLRRHRSPSCARWWNTSSGCRL